jgi:predicted secreted protein
VHVLAQHAPERGVEQVRGRVVALGVAAPVGGDAGERRAEGERAVERAHGGRAPLDLAHLVDVDAPAVADDLAAVAHLAAALGVERRLAQQHGHAPARQAPDGRDLRLDLHGVVADELAARVGAVRARGALPRGEVA